MATAFEGFLRHTVGVAETDGKKVYAAAAKEGSCSGCFCKGGEPLWVFLVALTSVGKESAAGACSDASQLQLIQRRTVVCWAD